ncbi:hypothetical protein [Tumebacillus permanentifrigoris]|uniref:Uncharacterized protein n=1 Tax=Tumebacillus permanentifrigoris TaxID=378543 RepID=A0A316D620_9BACL|nr:hypothetical protein [Tumebacillus permanentifrigoris]PWK07028.1 hypothetical protein C7459_118102 [Tumebacillus permanentifrigoris]
MQKIEAMTSGGKVELVLVGNLLSINLNGKLYKTVSFDGPDTVTNTNYPNKEGK